MTTCRSVKAAHRNSYYRNTTVRAPSLVTTQVFISFFETEERGFTLCAPPSPHPHPHLPHPLPWFETVNSSPSLLPLCSTFILRLTPSPPFFLSASSEASISDSDTLHWHTELWLTMSCPQRLHLLCFSKVSFIRSLCVCSDWRQSSGPGCASFYLRVRPWLVLWLFLST